jgi:hypothetical protein
MKPNNNRRWTCNEIAGAAGEITLTCLSNASWLRAGDEIYFGEACARFDLADSSATRHLSEVE